MSNNPTDVREFVKENAEMYRDAEESHQRHEDFGRFIQQNPTPLEEVKILEKMIE